MQYIALLRGINISGHRIIKMADLRSNLNKLGLKGLRTYIQSGNILFESEEKKQTLSAMISKSIMENFGYEVPVFILSPATLLKAVAQNPFPEAQPNRLYLTFFSSSVKPIGFGEIEKLKKDNEHLILKANILYFHCPDGAARSKINNNLIEKKFGCSATTRNWRTTTKLVQMLNQ